MRPHEALEEWVTDGLGTLSWRTAIACEVILARVRWCFAGVLLEGCALCQEQDVIIELRPEAVHAGQCLLIVDLLVVHLGHLGLEGSDFFSLHFQLSRELAVLVGEHLNSLSIWLLCLWQATASGLEHCGASSLSLHDYNCSCANDHRQETCIRRPKQLAVFATHVIMSEKAERPAHFQHMSCTLMNSYHTIQYIDTQFDNVLTTDGKVSQEELIPS